MRWDYRCKSGYLAYMGLRTEAGLSAMLGLYLPAELHSQVYIVFTYSWMCFYLPSKTVLVGPEEMAQQLGTLAALLEVQGSIPSTHMAAHNCNSSSSRPDCRNVVHRHTGRQNHPQALTKRTKGASTCSEALITCLC